MFPDLASQQADWNFVHHPVNFPEDDSQTVFNCRATEEQSFVQRDVQNLKSTLQLPVFNGSDPGSKMHQRLRC
jgi:hypothetical protein